MIILGGSTVYTVQHPYDIKKSDLGIWKIDQINGIITFSENTLCKSVEFNCCLVILPKTAY